MQIQIKPTKLARRMAEKGFTLHCEYGPRGGIQYFLEPGGKPVGRFSAWRTIAEGWVVADSPALFPGMPAQTYRVAS